LFIAADARSVPAAAAWLGALGAVPFLACAGAILFGPAEIAGTASDVVTAYGAIILSFLGGIQWGFATRNVPVGNEHIALLRRLSMSVLPSLMAWAALLVPRETGLHVLAGAFLLVFAFDIRAARMNAAPGWYPSLRMPLTFLVVASILGASLG